MQITVPSIINDPALITQGYWFRVYRNKEVARRAIRLARKAYTRCRLSEAQNWRCCWCKCVMRGEQGYRDSVTIEHVIPRSKGGLDIPDNWLAACFRCNNRRGNIDAAEFMRVIAWADVSADRERVCAKADLKAQRREEAERNRRHKHMVRMAHMVRQSQERESATVLRQQAAAELTQKYGETLPDLRISRKTRPKRMRRLIDSELAQKALREGQPNSFEPGSRAWKMYERYSTSVHVDTALKAA